MAADNEEGSPSKGATLLNTRGRSSSTAALYFNRTKGDRYPKNSNDLRHTWQNNLNTDETQMNWLFRLRNGRDMEVTKANEGVPNFPDIRKKALKTVEREEGPYQRKYQFPQRGAEMPEEDQTIEKYQNFANTRHMLQNTVSLRVSGGKAPEIDWQLQLRGSMHKKPDMKWKRYWQRPHQSFDLAAENLADPEYQKFSSTPIFTKRDRNHWSVPAVMHREDPIVMARWPGCEGTALNTWEHLVSDKKYGHKSRGQIKWETTLREEPSWDFGAKICDNRSSGNISEFLGKKKWNYSTPDSDLAKSYPEGGDVKLNHIKPTLGEPDEHSLALRRHKEKRKIEASDARTSKV